MKSVFIVKFNTVSNGIELVTFTEKENVLDFASKINENGELLGITEINENDELEKYEIVFRGRLRIVMSERPLRNDGSVGKW